MTETHDPHPYPEWPYPADTPVIWWSSVPTPEDASAYFRVLHTTTTAYERGGVRVVSVSSNFSPGIGLPQPVRHLEPLELITYEDRARIDPSAELVLEDHGVMLLTAERAFRVNPWKNWRMRAIYLRLRPLPFSRRGSDERHIPARASTS